MAFLNKLWWILFKYETKIFPDNKNMVYAATLGESQMKMFWWIIIEEFGPNIQHITGVNNIVADTLSRPTYTSIDKYKSIIMKSLCRTNELFATGGVENKKYFFPLNIFNVQID